MDNVDQCPSSHCSNLATCYDFVNGCNCICAPGWNGTVCDTCQCRWYNDLMVNGTSYDTIQHKHCPYHKEKQGSLSILNQSKTVQVDWLLCLCLQVRKMFSTSYKSPKTSSQIPQIWTQNDTASRSPDQPHSNPGRSEKFVSPMIRRRAVFFWCVIFDTCPCRP